MTEKANRTFQALILAVLGLYFIFKIVDGRILLYINQRFVPLVLAAALGLIILSQVIFRLAGSQKGAVSVDQQTHSAYPSAILPLWMLWLLALPVLVSVLIPERALDASAVESRGMNSLTPLTQNPGEVSVLDVAPEQRTILDWIRIFQGGQYLDKVEGQKAEITGFVYRDTRLPENQVMVGRFTITCCAADAVALGMLVESAQVGTLMPNTWVRVGGTIHIVRENGIMKPLLRATDILVIDEPLQPYLFP